MKINAGAAAFVGVTLLVGGQAVFAAVSHGPTGAPVATDPTVAAQPEVEEPEVAEPEAEVPEVEEPAIEFGGPEAAAEHREAMAAWKDCVAAAAAVAGETGEAGDVLTLCGTKPHPPGKALGWDGDRVSKSAQHKVDKAAGGKPEKAPKVERQAKPEKTPKAEKGKGHQR